MDYLSYKAGIKQKMKDARSKRDAITQIQKMFKQSSQDRLEISSEEVKYYNSELGITLDWDLSDKNTATEALLFCGTYEYFETQILKRLSEHSKVILDIGANIGFHTLLFAKNVQGKNSQIYAIEPIPSSYEKLEKNLQLNSVSRRVTLLNTAVGEFVGNLNLFLPKSKGSSATSAKKLHPGTVKKYSVPMTTIDFIARDLSIKYIDLIKIDVEGFEMSVLKGASEVIARNEPIIFCELLRKWSKAFNYHPQDVVNFLFKKDYTCWSIGTKLTRIEEINAQTVETNFLFVPRDKVKQFEQMFTESLNS